MLIAVKAKNNYGQFRFYPASKSAETLAAIAGTKTLEPRILHEAAKGFGATIVVVEGNCQEVAEILSRSLVAVQC